MTILPKAIYRFNAIPIKLPKAFFTELQFYTSYGTQKTLSSQTILRKKIPGGIRPLDLRLYKATVITNNKISGILTEKQSYRSVEPESRNKATHLCPPNL